MNVVHVVKCISCGKYNDDLVNGLCVNCEVEQQVPDAVEMQCRQDWTEYNNNSSVLVDICNIIEDIEDEFPVLKNPCRCGQDEIYSEKLTNNLCLNCYYQQEEDNKMMKIECEHDKQQGLI